jgi:hypothetical protein
MAVAESQAVSVRFKPISRCDSAPWRVVIAGSYFGDMKRTDIAAGIQSPSMNRRLCDRETKLVNSRRWRRPSMAPDCPGSVRLWPKPSTGNRAPIRAEAYLQLLDHLRAAQRTPTIRYLSLPATRHFLPEWASRHNQSTRLYSPWPGGARHPGTFLRHIPALEKSLRSYHPQG